MHFEAFFPALGAKLDDEDQRLMMLGQEVERRAMALFPEAAVIERAPGLDPVEATLAVLEDEPQAAAQGTLAAGGREVRFDVLRRFGDAWELIEIKSASRLDDSRHGADLEFQRQVLEEAGLPIASLQLCRINPFARSSDPLELFAFDDAAAAARKQQKRVEAAAKDLLPFLKSPDLEPPRRVGARCRNCRFQEPCLGPVGRDHIIHLPSIGHGMSRLGEKLFSEGRERMADVPEERLEKEGDRLARRAVLTGEPIIRPGLKEALDRIAWPAFFVDFETFQHPLPAAPGVQPNQVLPFQWSAQMLSGPEDRAEPLDFIDLESGDPSEGFCRSLLAAMAGSRSVVFYSDYEVQTLARLARRGVPGAEEAADLFRGLGVDLEKIVKSGIVHPDFRGRSSIKVVLPALEPEFEGRYKSLEVQHGGMAVMAYEQARRPLTTGAERDEWRRRLVEYCRLDVEAMAVILRALNRLAIA
jgi:hypothetical protein